MIVLKCSLCPNTVERENAHKTPVCFTCKKKRKILAAKRQSAEMPKEVKALYNKVYGKKRRQLSPLLITEAGVIM